MIRKILYYVILSLGVILLTLSICLIIGLIYIGGFEILFDEFSAIAGIIFIGVLSLICLTLASLIK